MFLDVATSTTPSPAPFPGHRLRVLSETIVNGGATLVFELENPGAGDENAAPRELRYVTDFSANGYAGD
jgi:hypothetical protein